MIPQALSCGITLEQFWTYDFSEIQLIFNNYEEKVKQDLARTYNESRMTASFVNILLCGSHIPELYEVFPQYFGEEDHTVQAEASFKAWAEQWNLRNKEEH